MDVLIVGSVALDDVKTPVGEVRQAIGGSAIYASLAAQFFSSAGIVGVIGNDFPETFLKLLHERQIHLEGLEKVAGKTFHWRGCYEEDMGNARTLETHLNVLASFTPKIPDLFRNTPYVFLANIDPQLQHQVLEQIQKPRFVLLDTMNYWIETKREELLEIIPRVHMVVINEAEARQLANTSNLIKAAEWIRQQGTPNIMIKKGEHGALILCEDQLMIIPAVPLKTVKDPTGAGDTFAGGFIGVLAQLNSLSAENIRAAAALGAVMASFAVEDFSIGRLVNLKSQEIQERYAWLQKINRMNEFPGTFMPSHL